MMNLFCCLSGRDSARIQKTTSPSSSEKTRDHSPADDIFSDEGASYQRDQWQLVLAQNRKAMQQVVDNGTRSKSIGIAQSDLLESLSDGHLTAEHCLQQLSAMYNQNKFAQRMPRIRAIFVSLEPFTETVATLAKTNTISALLWGSLALVFQSIIRFGSFWDEIQLMFEDLAKRLPRFHAYHQILNTPRLHSCLRDVYQFFITFCIKVIECVEGSQIRALIRIQWSSFAAELRSSIQDLTVESEEFEREVQLASCQRQAMRHQEVMTTLRQNELTTNINIPRNSKFTGQDEVLTSLQKFLEPSFRRELTDRVACSCLIHATGGMGKTETALEYTYRYRNDYDYIFWLRSQTTQLILESILEVVSILGLVKQDGLDTQRKVHMYHRWLQSTDKSWLLVFDNAEDINTIQPFWPASPRGAIIVTSQNPTVGLVTKYNIHLQPMTVDEGSSLIQNILQRGGSEEEEARLLSEHLGGLPLAIAHFAGAILKSQCPISQISQSFLKRAESSQVWDMTDDASIARAYQHTLNTVWDFAINRLSPDSNRLLELIAFIDADRVPVELFVGSSLGKGVEDTASWNYWVLERFNTAMASLCERHLVERYRYQNLEVLRTHRALQRSILHRLDRDIPKRNNVFNEVVSMVRKALPPPNRDKRGDEAQLTHFRKYLPQTYRLHSNFIESEPPIPGTFEFVTLLQDSAFFDLHGLGQMRPPLELLQTAESLCLTLADSDPQKSRSFLIEILSTMGPITQEFGLEGRAATLERMPRIFKLLDEETGHVPPEQRTAQQRELYTRAQVDYGWFLLQANRLEEANEMLEKSIEYYRDNGQDLNLAFAKIDRLYILATRQQKEQVREDANDGLLTTIKVNGEKNHVTLIMKFIVANAYFTIGDLEKAVEMWGDVLKGRIEVLGQEQASTLGTRYCLAVCLQNKNNLEGAEEHLRKILTVGQLNDSWTREDITRVKFRLWLVLLAQNRPKEAEKFSVANDLRRVAAPDEVKTRRSQEDTMALLDANVSLAHGRTAGIFGSGTFW